MPNLQISPCHRETARQRYQLPRLARIPFEHRHLVPPPAPVTATDTAEGGTTDTGNFFGLDDSVASGTGHPEVADGDGEDDGGDGGDGDDGDDGDDGNDGAEEHAALTAAADDHEEPHNEADDSSAEGSEDYFSEESDDDPSEDSDNENFPLVSQWRLNLTALSQRYNLYFAAYRNSIHVSRPRSCVTHSLPAAPDLTLMPAASRQAWVVLGAMDVSYSHQVNHLIVGLLGELEILLMAYDDGDVIGYYTKPIEDTIGDSSSPVRRHDLTPFFHENVGRSAWGLAIHQESRLIAVGSNAHAATVFVPALVSETETSPPGSPGDLDLPPPQPSSLFPVLRKDAMGQVVFSELLGFPEAGPRDVDAWFRLRTRSFRIEIPTGESGHNIPNLTFGSDKKGCANKILAVDVRANLWVMCLVSNKAPIRIPGIHPQTFLRGVLGEPVRSMAWGVLCIPKSSFLLTKNFRDALGLDKEEAKYLEWHGERWIDISRGIQHVPNNSTVHRWSRRPNTPFQRDHSELVEQHPWFGTHEVLEYPPDWDDTLNSQEEERFLRDGSSILRTYEADFELMPYKEGSVGIMYERSITQAGRPDMGPAQLGMERLGTLLLVPELSLVVGASMSGRVALVTLTRHRAPDETTKLKRGFKIEAILPTEQDENENLRPLCPLYGVAVGPVSQTTRAKRAAPSRFRLMIHYYDLSILSYEISRDPGTQELKVS